jgi:hypothetical protein
MERAMGIELHPKILSLIERRRYRRSKSQVVPFDAKQKPMPVYLFLMLI